MNRLGCIKILLRTICRMFWNLASPYKNNTQGRRPQKNLRILNHHQVMNRGFPWPNCIPKGWRSPTTFDFWVTWTHPKKVTNPRYLEFHHPKWWIGVYQLKQSLVKPNHQVAKPIQSMYGIFTYIWLIFMVNVGKYTIHGFYGKSHKKPNHQERITVPWCCVMRALLDAWRGSRHGCDHRWGGLRMIGSPEGGWSWLLYYNIVKPCILMSIYYM